MTRLYTTSFRCAVCLREGPFGWLYRCTQDRELVLEDDIDRGYPVDKIDGLYDTFDKPNAPRTRSPAARLSKLSFLEEVSDEELKTYTKSQISQILHQRAQVLDLAAESATSPPEARFYTPPSSKSARSTFPSPSKPPSKNLNKPWLPIQGGECQFKCCHKCRPTLGERAYLSLNGIADNDVPLTASTGFGFHLDKVRPVTLVKYVKSIGLRPSPPPRSHYEDDTRRRVFLAQNFAASQNPDPPFGLGIFSTESADPSPPAPPNTPSASPPLLSGLSVSDTVSTVIPSIGIDESLTYSSKVETVLDQGFPIPPDFQPSFRPDQLTRPTLTATPSFNMACSLPLPIQTLEELEATKTPLTPMEKDELNDGKFGSRPLEVRNGVAVKEEGVEGHWADVVTQL
ncbi:uncharacterized protein BP5553_03791 [Venustampulla echinocandica]|uniref:Uncharacterized protein n=1 Tax=Venustampulla echinocandica TaxID=2656787 RepID=A0A370TVA2_9HELO|nr:uncharacterized protein BP5553_03791 [Venustampulla echinocandica]RDL39451.1 hypothetical protein BP5553_03791 [Venustampulla echinocandica]